VSRSKIYGLNYDPSLKSSLVYILDFAGNQVGQLTLAAAVSDLSFDDDHGTLWGVVNTGVAGSGYNVAYEFDTGDGHILTQWSFGTSLTTAMGVHLDAKNGQVIINVFESGYVRLKKYTRSGSFVSEVKHTTVRHRYLSYSAVTGRYYIVQQEGGQQLEELSPTGTHLQQVNYLPVRGWDLNEAGTEIWVAKDSVLDRRKVSSLGTSLGTINLTVTLMTLCFGGSDANSVFSFIS